MYEVDERDIVKEITDVPQSATGAPLPTVIATEDRLDLFYLVQVADPDTDGPKVKSVGPGAEKDQIAHIGFDHAYAHMFGPPNDEAFEGHPLASRGLSPYSAWEVLHSSWIRGLDRMNSVHRRHDSSLFSDLRHFIFAFHDSTFECVAGGMKPQLLRGMPATVAAALHTSWD